MNQAFAAVAVRGQLAPDGSVRAERRQELAQHALATLAELGYARVNLRDIATRSGLSLGVIHYHFKDKNELLAAAVTLYKEDFLQQVEGCIVAARSRASLADNLGSLLQQAVTQHGTTHRFWYDIRAQALFDETFFELVSDLEQRLVKVIEQGLKRLSALGENTGRTMPAAPVIDPTLIYITLDGWFRFYLQRFIMGDATAPNALKKRVAEIFNPEALAPAQ